MPRLPYLVIGGVGVLVLIIVLAVFGVGRKPPRQAPADLQFWGMEDEEGTWQRIISAFREQYPHISITYYRLNEATYEDVLFNRLAAGTGPDIFVLKNSWIVKHRNKVAPLPQQALGFTVRNLSNAFVDGVADELVSPTGGIIGLPLFLDTLALFYNKDIFNAAGIAIPPKTWGETEALSRQLTKTTQGREIIKSGIALGSSKNIEHAFEIVSALMFQYGAPVAGYREKSVSLDGAEEAFSFYTSFADQTSERFSWTPRLKNSLDAFAEGTTAMMIGNSQDIGRLRAKNPHLRFGIVSFPQRRGVTTPLTYGTHFFPTVSLQSRNQLAAWQFILFAAAEEGAAVYLENTERPPAKRDLIAAGAPKPELEVFWRQALVAKSWAVPDEETALRLFQETIDAVVNRTENAGTAVGKLRSRLNVLFP